MNLERYHHGDGFAFGDYKAELRFKTATSAGFYLGTMGPLRFGKTGDPSTDKLHERFAPNSSINAFHVLGFLDVHHPCNAHIKVQLRVSLPERDVKRLHGNATLSAPLVRTVFNALGIPQDETYEVLYFVAQDPMMVVESVDRDGRTDRI